MSKSVIDVFQTIQIHEQNQQFAVIQSGNAEGLLSQLLVPHAVIHTGQRIHDIQGRQLTVHISQHFFFMKVLHGTGQRIHDLEQVLFFHHVYRITDSYIANGTLSEM